MPAEPIDSPAPRRLVDGEPDGATARPAPDGGPIVSTPQLPVSPSAAPIATLDAPPLAAGAVPDNPRTGEPRVPWVVRIASGLSFASVAAVVLSLLLVYWDAVSKENFGRASWLMGQFVTEPGSLGRVLLAVAVTVITLLIAIPLAITGYYAWTGYRWTRVSAIIGAVLSFGALTLNQPAWSAIPPALAAAVLLWLPGASAFFTAWRARRHPAENFAPPTTDVFYGPLPRYR